MSFALHFNGLVLSTYYIVKVSIWKILNLAIIYHFRWPKLIDECVRASEWVKVCECIAIKRQSKLACMPIHLEQFERVLFSQLSNADTYICIASLGSAWAFFNDGVLIMCNYFWYNVVDEYLKSGTDERDSILACNFGKSLTLLNLYVYQLNIPDWVPFLQSNKFQHSLSSLNYMTLI